MSVLLMNWNIESTGESSVSLAQNYRLGKCSVNRVIHDTCKAIILDLGPTFMKVNIKRLQSDLFIK